MRSILLFLVPFLFGSWVADMFIIYPHINERLSALEATINHSERLNK